MAAVADMLHTTAGESPPLLRRYAPEQQGMVHMRACLKKNLALKARAKRHTACEVLAGPLMMGLLAFIASYSGFTETPAMGVELAGPPDDISRVIRDGTCVRFTNATASAASRWRECTRAEQDNPAYRCYDGLYETARYGVDAVCMDNTAARYADMPRMGWGRGERPHMLIDLDDVLLVEVWQRLMYVSSVAHEGWFPGSFFGSVEFATGHGVSCEAVGALVDRMSARHAPFFDELLGRRDAMGRARVPYTPGTHCRPGVWKSESRAVAEADRVATSTGIADAGRVWVLIVVKDVDWDAKQLDFKLRMNSTIVPSTQTRERKADAARTLADEAVAQYVSSGFLSWEAAVADAFFGAADTKIHARMAYAPMPVRAQSRSEFYDAVGGVMSMIAVLAFMYIASKFIALLVEEKESRQREAMLIMGLTKRAFFASWYLTYATLTTLSVLLMVLAAWDLFHATPLPFLFATIWLAAQAVLALSMMFSAFFTNARLAATLGPVFLFGLTLPYSFLKNTATTVELRLLCLLPQTAFGLALDMFADGEITKQGVTSLGHDYDGISFGFCLFMLVVDTVLYLLLAWYLDDVLPSKWGLRKHPLYCLPRALRRMFLLPAKGCSDAEQGLLDGEGGCGRGHVTPAPRVMEVYDEATAAKLASRRVVAITQLTKRFKGMDHPAVDAVGTGMEDNTLAFHTGQIQVVLGQNGAGKTTLINMLTGMLPPDAGFCSINGKSVLTDMDAVRADLGYCPQHNIIWPQLSCEEHLRFFGRLKNVPEPALREVIPELLNLLCLGEKTNARAATLSGGQKRKLSIAIALVGGAKIVFLDEPTAGMDVGSRRAMWKLLRRPEILRDRCIILTTHYMDEADVLGDSIAIMNNGHVHALGSPYYLKQKLGAGYNLMFAVVQGCDVEGIVTAVRGKVPEARCVSSSGNEVRVHLPGYHSIGDEQVCAAVGQGVPQGVVRAILAAPPEGRAEAIMAVTGQSDVHALGGAGQELTATAHAALVAIADAARAQANFPALFAMLERDKDILGVESFGVGLTTLNEVFLSIANGTEGVGSRKQVTNPLPPRHAAVEDGAILVEPSPSPSSLSSAAPTPTSREGALIGDRVPPRNTLSLYSVADLSSVSGWRLTFSQIRALFIKRWHIAKRDAKVVRTQLVYPVLIIIVAVWLGGTIIPTYPERVLDAGEYRAPLVDVMGAATNTVSPWQECVADGGARAAAGVCDDGWSFTSVGVGGVQSLVRSVFANAYNHGGRDKVFAVTSDAPVDTVLYNMSFPHAAAVSVAAWANARLADTSAPTAHVRVSSHPLPLTSEGRADYERVGTLVMALSLLGAFSLLPANFIMYVVREREKETKMLQLVSGTRLSAYWVSNFMFDLAAFGITLSAILIVFVAFERNEYIGSASTAAGFIVLCLSYAAASILSAYAASFVFKRATTAQSTWSLVNYLVGMILVFVSFILDSSSSTQDTNAVLKNFYRLLPAFCLGNGIMNMSTIHILGTTVSHVARMGSGDDLGVSVWDWDGILCEIVFCLVTIPLYSGVIYLAEQTWLYRWLRTCFGKRSEDDGDGSPMDVNMQAERGGDVRAERQAIVSGLHDPCSVVVRGLTKRFGGGRLPLKRKPKITAVDDLTFGVRRGELFAFLGTNGAGKTTTISMMAGELAATAGTITVDGFDVDRQRHAARQRIGLCPQFDVLFDELSPVEHLKLYSSVRGIPAAEIPGTISSLINAFGLAEHEGKRSCELSGGNKRKLCVCIALIGGPSVVFLDEPSAGMDPAARCALWGALEDACQNRSVVLTTHHLEEVEGLAHLRHRVSIMKSAKLECIGSLQQLKNRYGDAYELVIRAVDAAAEPRVHAFIAENFPTAVLVESALLRHTFNIPCPVALSTVFATVEAHRAAAGISDYSVAETSLEQVFLRIAAAAEDGDDDGDEDADDTPPAAGGGQMALDVLE